MRGLNNRQEQFCFEYVKDFNATQAAIRAGYSSKGASVHASKLLGNANIQARIQDLQKDIQERSEITVDELIRELSNIARIDPIDIFNNDGSLKSLSEMKDMVRKSIKSIQISEYTYQDGSQSVKRKIELHSKLDAIEKLMRYFGAYEKDNEQKVAKIEVVQIPDNGRE